MHVLVPFIGLVGGAFGVWLVVRVLNRRERWAKRLLVGMVVGLPVAYVLSVGPVMRLQRDGVISDSLTPALTAYYTPLEWTWYWGPNWWRRSLLWYLRPYWPPGMESN